MILSREAEREAGAGAWSDNEDDGEDDSRVGNVEDEEIGTFGDVLAEEADEDDTLTGEDFHALNYLILSPHHCLKEIEIWVS